jgi:hypothetical protein
MLRTLLAAVAILLIGASSAPASSLALRDTGLTPTIARGDAGHLLATAVDDGDVSVLDTRTRTWSTVPSPAGCRFVDAHHGTLLWNCPPTLSGPQTLSGFPTGVTYEIATRSLATLPALMPPFGNTDSARYGAIGDHFARMDLGGYHYVDLHQYVDRATGRQSYESARLGRIRDLDAPGLVRALCAGAPRPQVEGAFSLLPGEPVVSGRWSAATALSDNPDVGSVRRAPAYIGHVQAQRCGAKAHTVRVCRTVICSQPLIDGRFIAWTETRGISATSTRLVVRTLRSGRVRRTPWATLLRSPLLVDYRLYVLETPSTFDPARPLPHLMRATL